VVAWRPRLLEERVHPPRRVRRRVVLETQLRRDPHAEGAAELPAQERRGAAQRPVRFAWRGIRRERSEVDTRHAEIRRDPHPGERHRLQTRITRLAEEQVGELRLNLVRHPLATMLRHASSQASIMQELHALLAELGELQVVDEPHHLAQAGVDVALLRTHLADTERRPLPERVVLALRDRHLELVLHPRLDGAEHAPLAFERVILGEEQLETEDADHHAGPGMPQAWRSAGWATWPD